ncbi:protein kinase domain-containing protein [Paraliomyxa miuraensis]|uniref:protein kinase domain-containing protein n=1 Tax=Paraliomyxa miuraensis TaxID=376150 RepID=UPI00224FF944|nr:protein kinase [Paraliomyxa miuraensis]MCX4246380.1 protein kinase [Paraliomyxa miuraensis]
MSDAKTIELQVDDVVDERYRITRRLGRGGMGTVYQAQQVKLDRAVAFKVLLPEYATKETAAKRFEREARAASSIDHRNVVKILDFGHLPTGELYYTMELLQGRDLSQLLRETGALPWSRAGWIILQVVRAFAAIHAQGIVHRDIKPANCFLLDPKAGDEPDFVKILDFGIANLQDESNKVTALTGASDIIGSVLYMAPEQIMADHVDSRTDVYSLGIMMYELLTGQVPFRESNMMKVMLAHQQQAPRPPSELAPDLPPEVEEVILRAIAKKPEERFQAMVDIEAVLAPLVEVPGTIEGSRTVPRIGTSATFPGYVEQKSPRWVRPVIAAVLLFGAAIAVTQWIKHSRQTDDEIASNTTKTAKDDASGESLEDEPEPEPLRLLPPPEKQYDPFADPFGAPPLTGRMGPPPVAAGAEGETEAIPSEPVPLEELLPAQPWTLEVGRMAGRILNDKERPLSGARVCAWMVDPRAPAELRRRPKCAQTDRQGRFVLDEVPPGFYDLHAFARGFLPQSVLERDGYPLTLQPEGRLEKLEVVLAPGGTEVRGTVETKAGEPIAGAKVAVVGPVRALAVADGKGEFTLWTGEGDLSVVAWAEGYADLVAQGRSDEPFALVLRRESKIIGRVIDEEGGEPIAAARVQAGRQGPGLDPLVYTDDEGIFEIVGLSEGTYQPSARLSDGYGQAKRATKVIEATIPGEVVIELHHFKVADAAPEPTVAGSTGAEDEPEATGSTGDTDATGSTGDDATGGEDDSALALEDTPPSAAGTPAAGTPTDPDKPAVTNRSLRAALAKKLKRCGAGMEGSIEVTAEYVLDKGRLFKPKVTVKGAANKDPAVKACAEKHVERFKMLPRDEPTDFVKLPVTL